MEISVTREGRQRDTRGIDRRKGKGHEERERKIEEGKKREMRKKMKGRKEAGKER